MENFDDPQVACAAYRQSTENLEILYAAPVEPCRRNGWHVQGDGMKEFSGLWHHIIPVINQMP